jgi:hypothetical protein
MEPDGSLSCSQDLAIGPNPEPDKSSAHSHALFFKIHVKWPPYTPSWGGDKTKEQFRFLFLYNTCKFQISELWLRFVQLMKIDTEI